MVTTAAYVDEDGDKAIEPKLDPDPVHSTDRYREAAQTASIR
jgi:hypothetical protein